MPESPDIDLYQSNSKFHKQTIGNIDVLTEQLEMMVQSSLDYQESSEPQLDIQIRNEAKWEQLMGHMKTSLQGLQTFLTGVQLEHTRLNTEAEEIEQRRKALLSEREELIERSHHLHCRIQYNLLEKKLDETFTNTEKCMSVESARCFKDEADENLRRTKDMLRIGTLRSCQLDMDIFNKMETITNILKSYEKERETYCKELDLFDDVRRRKIYNWMRDTALSDEELEKGEVVVEYLDVSARKRNLEPKVISNALRAYSLNETLSFDRQDYKKRLEEMESLQSQLNTVSGADTILPRKVAACTNLSGLVETPAEDGEGAHAQPPIDDDAYRHIIDTEYDNSCGGHGLHRCPRKVNLATDPITDPEVLPQLEAALRWEAYDSLTIAASSTDPITMGTDNAELSCSHNIRDTSSTPSLSDSGSILGGRGGVGSNASLCGDSILPEKGDDNKETPEKLTPTYRPHVFLPEMKSATSLQADSAQSLMVGLVKRKLSSGRASSMTAIIDGDPVAGTSTEILRESRSQGWESSSSSGRPGSSSGTTGGGPGMNHRNSQYHVIPGSGRGKTGE